MKTLFTFLGVLLLVTAAHAGTFSTAAWTDDASTGIVSGQTVWAYHFGETTTTTVNGVSVAGAAGPAESNADFSLAGTVNYFNGDDNNLIALTGTGSAVIANDFVYDGNPATIMLNALTVGQTYTVSFLSVGFEDAGFRLVTFSSGTDNLLVDQDQFGDDHGIRVDYTFTASAATRVINIALSNANSASFHFYGLALRTEPAPMTVTNTNDTGTGSLRWAVRNARDRTGVDTVTFNAALNGATITLSSVIDLSDPSGVTLDASGLAAGLTIDGGLGNNRIFEVNPVGTASLIGLTLKGGNGAGGNGGAIYNFNNLTLTRCTLSGNSAGAGGAIQNDGGTLTLTQCTLSGNSATGTGGAISQTSGSLTLMECTLSGNRSDGIGGAGAIRSSFPGTLTLTHCTITGNSTTLGSGGAINHGGTALTLTHCTISGNTCAYLGGAMLVNNGQFTLTNSIVAGNADTQGAPDIYKQFLTINAVGVNFIGDTTGSDLAASPTILTGDPLLAPLASNGGLTQTMAPTAGSPVIDAVSAGNEVSGLTSDQRGFPRALDGDGNGSSLPDIGAFETRNIIVTTAADELNTPSSGGAGISLREALRDGGTDLITFATGFTGPIMLGSDIVVNDTTRCLSVDATTLPDGLTIDGGPGKNRIFTVSPGASLALRGLTLTGGNGDGALFSGGGGAILNALGTLTLTQCTLSGNAVASPEPGIGGSGGAIFNDNGKMTLNQCLFSGNTVEVDNAGTGGAIYNFNGSPVLTQCTFADNSTSFGGAIFSIGNGQTPLLTLTQCTFTGNSASQSGGAISNNHGALTLTHCTVSGNAAHGDAGGAILSSGTVSTASTVKVTLTHCTLSGNTASTFGGGIYASSSTLELANNIVAGNTSSFGGPDILRSGGTITPIGLNFIGDTEGSTLTANSIILTTAANGSINLAPLANNGGPTQTMALRPGSPAIDSATNITGLTTDQRGYSRKLDGNGNGIASPDLGAFELGHVIVTTAADELDTPSSGGTGISLREALRDCPAGGRIDFDPALVGQSIVLGSLLEVAKDVTIDATSLGSLLTVSGNNTTNVFHVVSGVSASFIRLTITEGNSSYGGGIYVEGALVCTECSLEGNTAFAGGAAALAQSGTSKLTLDRCTVSGNTADFGGGIQNEGTLVCTQSTFANNTAAVEGGAISAPFGKSVMLRHCTISGNTATTGGGAIGSGIALENSILAGNTAPTAPNISGTPKLIGTNLTSGDPRLSALGNFGGLTQTMIPLLGSPALDQAKALTPALTTDQRSQPRPLGIRPDIGAVEGSVIIVTTPVDELDPPGSLGAGVSLREAVRDVPTFGTIAFDRAVFNSPTKNTITLTKGPLNPQRICYAYGTMNPGGIKIVNTLTITQQPQPLSVLANSPAFFLVNATALNGGLAYQWRKDGLNIANITTALNFASAQESDEGVYDVVISEAPPPGLMLVFDVLTSSAPVISQPASLIVDGSPVTILRHPANAMIALGSSHTLSVVAAGPGTLSYYWYLNGKEIKGANSRTYTIAKAALTHAGEYTCVVSSGSTTTTPGTAEIGVVDTTPKAVNLLASATASFTATVNAAGNGPLTYAWLKNGSSTAFTTKSFTIKPAGVVDAGLYTCTVTGLAGTFTGGAPTRLTVSNAAPQIVQPLSLPAAVIGHNYFYQIPIANVVGAPVTAFTVGGLPPGMTWDKLTGIISGRPTASTKPLGYPLTIKASNPKSSDSATATLMVNIVPASVVGVFAGPLERSALNDNLGGRFDLTTTADGLCSGSITLGARAKLSFTKQLLLSAGTGDVILRANLSGMTMADKTPLTAYFEVFTTDQTARLTLVHPNGTTLLATAWRNAWSKTRPATAYAATYTARLDPANFGSAPRGYGFATLTVAADGSLKTAGKLPDGSGLTQAGFVGPEGQLTLFSLLYAKRGSLVGPMQITAGTPVANNTLGATLSWFKPAPLPKSTDTIYQAGFGPLNVIVEGSPYVAPAKGQRVMGMGTSPNPNAKLDFTLGGLAPEFAQLLYISNPSATGLTNKGTLTLPLTNSTKLTTLDAAKGSFTGSFQINGATTALNRPALFEGLIVKIGATTQGYGYFLLPTATAKISTSPKLSGRVVLGVP